MNENVKIVFCSYLREKWIDLGHVKPRPMITGPFCRCHRIHFTSGNVSCCDICLIIRDSVTCHPTKVNAPRLNLRGIGTTSRLSVRPSVRLSVCLPVMLRYSDHIHVSWKSCGCTKHRIELLHYVWSSEALLYRSFATPYLVVNVVDEL